MGLNKLLCLFKKKKKKKRKKGRRPGREKRINRR